MALPIQIRGHLDGSISDGHPDIGLYVSSALRKENPVFVLELLDFVSFICAILVSQISAGGHRGRDLGEGKRFPDSQDVVPVWWSKFF